MRFRWTFLLAAVLAGSLALAETAPPHPKRQKNGATRAATAVTGPKLEARKRFVLDVLHSALALPQDDPQDRLRVLVQAAQVAHSVSGALSKSLVRQGIELETQLISSGQKPAASMLESGLVDCRVVAGLVDAVRPEDAAGAERSLAAAVTHCPRQALEPLQRKLADAVRQRSVAPRLALAAMEAAGPKSAWTAQQFEALFSSLPDAKTAAGKATEYADVFRNFADAVDMSAARSAGVKLLAWLGEMDVSPERVEAVTAVASEMKKVLGQERYDEALQSDVMAAQAAQVAGQPFEISPSEEEAPVLVSRLFGQKEDRSAELEDMPAAQRAREAAASGFAAGHDGDLNLAERYFDVAFRAVNEAWSNRRPGEDVNNVIEQVCEAAAHVDALKALAQAQRLLEPPARAVSMLAVARVVLNAQDPAEARPKK